MAPLGTTALVLAAIMAPLGDSAAPEIPQADGVRSTLLRAQLTGAITVGDRAVWLGDFERARLVVRRLSGAREGELRAVLSTLEDEAAEGRLTPSRMPLAFATLRANTTQWGKRAFPIPGTRTTFGTDPAVFQYFPGQGVQFHPLGTAGRAAALAPACMRATAAHERREAAREARLVAAASERAMDHRTGAVMAPAAPAPAGAQLGPTGPGAPAPADAGATGATGAAGAAGAAPPATTLGRHARARRGARGFGCHRADLRALLDTLVRFSSIRDGFRAWEYDFSFAGSRPLWISAMSQATAAQALARGADALGEPAYRDMALASLAAFDVPPPLGVRLPQAVYAMYSFNPTQRVLNGYLQAIIGLHDVAQLTGSAHAQRLYVNGERTARGWVPDFDTGAWSRYSLGGDESNLNYHELVTNFLGGLCRRTGRATYCDTEARFTRYLHEPPRIHLLQPDKLRPHVPTAAVFSLSKISHGTATIRRIEGGTVPVTILRDSFDLPRGAGYRYAWTPPRAGTYEVKVAATGPEGLTGVTKTTVTVKKPPKPKKPKKKDGAKRRGTRQSAG